MGVPAFFGWILKNLKYRSVLSKKLDKRPKSLYIDANCFFHPQCFKILKYFPNETDSDILEDYMIKRIIKFFIFLENYVNPTDYIYLAVDGVAPIAKQKQQRGRRIRAILDTEERNKIKQKYGIATNDVWSNIVITPGTNFMDKLDKALKNHFKK
jgi:5'-3' exonuclease